MLACNERISDKLGKLTYPLYASPKYDGIRAYVCDGKLYSRKNILIPNKHAQAAFGRRMFNGFDGELILSGKERSFDCFQATSSAVMSEGGTPKVLFKVFDICNLNNMTFAARYAVYRNILNTLRSNTVLPVLQTIIKDELQLLYYEEQTLKAGYEGVMLRSFNSPYKQGRSTLREGYLLKLKRFREDAEAEIVGFEELEHNDNELTVSNTGAAKRSSHKAGKRSGGVLGSFVLKMNFQGADITFTCGSGLTDKDRADFWERRPELLGKVVKFKYQPIGVKDKPRTPVFLGFRDPID